MHQILCSGRARTALVAFVSLFGLATLSSCSGSASGEAHGGAFVIVDTQPTMNGSIFLNDTVRVTFSRPIDLDTVSFNSCPFFVRDASGNALEEAVVGTFRHGHDSAGRRDPHVLEFVPRMPSNDDFSNGGLRPSRNYVVSFVTATSRAAPTVRDMDGNVLSPDSPLRSLRFQTVSGSTPEQLFRNEKRGGPRVVSVTPNRTIDGRLPLNRMAALPLEIAIAFDQALSPRGANLPTRASRDPRAKQSARRGRIWLEYDDPVLGDAQWIPAWTEVAVNRPGMATIVLHPDGVLPNRAEIRVIVDAQLADISGESNVGKIRYERVVARFSTEEALAREFDSVVWDFESEELSDPQFASFDFDGIETPLDYRPTSATNILNTDFARLAPSNGLPFDVVGGVFRINDLVVKEGVSVRGVGTNPMVWLASGDVRIDGHLHVDGGNGAQVDGLLGANYPVAGGQAGCGGGNGGRGSPSTTSTSPRGGNGAGPRQAVDGGGQGGSLACGSFSAFGAGGGGGSHVQQGDADFVRVFGADARASGRGGNGQGSRATPGGDAGPRVVSDARDDNDFWGRTLDENGNALLGELRAPVGGAGGGGGGHRTSSPSCDSGTRFGSDSKGGSAGVLIVRALGRITIGPRGRISANGGSGGGGQSAGTSRQGGGGAGGSGGSGGMIVLEAPKIIIYQHGDRWANRDTRFAIEADGGVGLDSFTRRRKYLRGGRPNSGGFGGMGLIQLMTPAGDDSDQTGNRLDDNIVVLDANDVELPKTPLLVDGDIRPNPRLLPASFGRFSAWSSRYVSTGASVRRIVDATVDAGARATTTRPRYDTSAELFGPEYSFAGLHTDGGAQGYLRTDDAGRVLHDSLRIDGRDSFALRGTAQTGEIVRGRLATRIEVDVTIPDTRRVSDFSVRFFDAGGNKLGDSRVLRAEGKRVWVDARDGVVPSNAASCRFVAKFVEVVTGLNPGLGPTYEIKRRGASVRVPISNVQIGFAFHRDPEQAKKSGTDKLRFPQTVGSYVYDLQSEGAASRREALRRLHFPFVKVHVRFNTNYDPDKPNARAGFRPVNAETELPSLRWLALPFVY